MLLRQHDPGGGGIPDLGQRVTGGLPVERAGGARSRHSMSALLTATNGLSFSLRVSGDPLPDRSSSFRGLEGLARVWRKCTR